MPGEMVACQRITAGEQEWAWFGDRGWIKATPGRRDEPQCLALRSGGKIGVAASQLRRLARQSPAVYNPCLHT